MWISLVFLVIISQDAVEARVRRAVGLSNPDIKRIVVLDLPGFEVYWNRVENADINNPIQGYKVKVWEVPGRKVFVSKIINGTEELVEETKPATIFDELPPNAKPKVSVVGADKNMTVIDDVKKHVLYHIRVQAFTKTEDGPLSPPTGLEIGGDS